MKNPSDEVLTLHQAHFKLWVPINSNWRFCLGYLPKLDQLLIAAIIEYANTLRKISERYQEPALAKLKLQWWKGEIDALYEKTPSHPVTTVLSSLANSFKCPKPLLLALVQAYELSLDTQQFSTQPELAQHYQYTGGIWVDLIGQVLLRNQHLETELFQVCQRYSHTLGVALETVRHLMETPHHLCRGHLYFPMDSLSKNNIDPETLFANPSAVKALPLLLSEQAQQARIYDQQAKDLLPLSARGFYRPLTVYAKLTFRELFLVERSVFKVLESTWELSPLQKWWLTI